jgi:hypothetical protein
MPVRIARRRVETRLIIDGEAVAASKPDPALVKAVARGHAWFETSLADARARSPRSPNANVSLDAM